MTERNDLIMADIIATRVEQKPDLDVLTFERLDSTDGRFPDEVRLTRSLYGASPDACLAVLRDLPDANGHAMIVGHNPTLEELVALLVGEAHAMPTAALAVVELPIESWRDIDPIPRGTLRALFLPRELGG